MILGQWTKLGLPTEIFGLIFKLALPFRAGYFPGLTVRPTSSSMAVLLPGAIILVRVKVKGKPFGKVPFHRKDIALQSAKLAYIENTDQFGAHPYYWAGFIPIGDMHALKLETHCKDGNIWKWVLPLLFVGLLIFIRFRRKR